jgi:hypothetical protein
MRYLLILLLAGCSGGFVKQGAQPGEWERDLYACRKEAAPAAGTREYTRTMDGCLGLKCWREK